MTPLAWTCRCLLEGGRAAVGLGKDGTFAPSPLTISPNDATAMRVSSGFAVRGDDGGGARNGCMHSANAHIGRHVFAPKGAEFENAALSDCL